MNFISSALPLLVSTLLTNELVASVSENIVPSPQKIPQILNSDSWFPTPERLEDYGNNPFNNRDRYQAHNPTMTCSRLYYPVDARETNLPGRASKGYGGYGGNGGLRQYYGYWQPDYQGQRNRGYGYYTNTDYYGLPRSQQAARGQYINAVRNYRGYD
uniref:Uncharacterized protein n=1 Tax=Glossina morsitans morsitans TaxID=37546 RepID=A0A1B0G365_GLOMM